jgi:hypothetical protein
MLGFSGGQKFQSTSSSTEFGSFVLVIAYETGIRF